MDYKQLLSDHLDLVDQIVRAIGRRRHLSREDTEELGGHVRLKLVDDDYAIVRKFKGRSSFRTYLAAVIERLTLDYLDALWGRWRPSRTAERLGPVAVQLERLVSRDGYALGEAIEILRTNHAVHLTERELRAMWDQLPARSRHARVEKSRAALLVSIETPDVAIEHGEREEDVAELERALAAALAQCTNAERLLLALRFEQGLNVGEIARVTGTSPATIHRQFAALLPRLRSALEGSTLPREQIVRLIGDPRLGIAPLLRKELERLSKFVRLHRRDG